MTEGSAYIHLLELPVNDVKADGSWHRLAVKVDRNGLDVQARRGYSVPRPEKKKAIKNGRPATGVLTKNDFTIAEDNKPQRTFSFEAPETHPFEDAGADPFDGQSRTIFVLDLLNSNFQDFSSIRDSAEKFFEAQQAQLKSPTETA